MGKEEFVKKAREAGMPEEEIKKYLDIAEDAVKDIGITMLETHLKIYKMTSEVQIESYPIRNEVA